MQLTTVDSSQLAEVVRVDRWVVKLERSSVFSKLYWLEDEVRVFLEPELEFELEPFLTV